MFPKILRIIGLLGVTTALATTAAWAQSKVWTAWGSNSSGQFGNGTTTDSLVPVVVPQLSEMVSVSSGGGFHFVGLKHDGTVWAWGANERNQLGDGTTTGSAVPVRVVGLSGVFTAVAAGRFSGMALRNDGTVWEWGRYFGMDANGYLETRLRSTAFQVPGLTSVTAISGGLNHKMALLQDGTVKVWGYSFLNALGLGPDIYFAPVPETVPGLNNVISINATWDLSVALKSDGTVWTWGLNDVGQLGTGSTDQYPSTPPSRVSQISDVIAIATGYIHVLALKSDGSIWTWGYETGGRLENGIILNSNVPVRVSAPGTMTAITAAGRHNLAIKADGTVFDWPTWNVPVQVSWLTNATAIAASTASGAAQSGNSAELGVNGLIGMLQDSRLAINAGQMNSLLVKLRNAMQRLSSNNRSGAISMLQAFNNELNSFVANGLITSASAAPLIAASNAIIAIV